MGISDIIRKLMWGNIHKAQEGQFSKGKTPDEVELESYEREEYLHNVKRKLAYFRNKKNHEAIVGTNPLSMRGTILQKNKHSLMH